MQSIWTYSLVLVIFTTSVLSIRFLEYGEKCEIPTNGNTYGFQEDCNAAHGLLCQSEGYCDCTFKQRFSYDVVSKECRRRIGVSCHYMEDTSRLPFNLKCHENAECVQLSMPSDKEKFSICACKQGYVSSENFDRCEKIPPALDQPGDLLVGGVEHQF